MDKTLHKVTNLKEQQGETYRYWHSVSDSERMNATWEFTLEMYRMKDLVQDAQGLNDLLSAFNAYSVRYLIVGGYATRGVLSRAQRRTSTSSSDWIRAMLWRLIKSLAEYGAFLAGATIADFATPGTVFQIGVAPFRIDILCKIDGLTFEEAWATSETAFVDDIIPVRNISCDNLIANKIAAGRP